MGRPIELSDEERAKLEAQFLRLELLNREVLRLFEERDKLWEKIQSDIRAIESRLGLKDGERLNPVFQDFKLVRLEIESQDSPS